MDNNLSHILLLTFWTYRIFSLLFCYFTSIHLPIEIGDSPCELNLGYICEEGPFLFHLYRDGNFYVDKILNYSFGILTFKTTNVSDNYIKLFNLYKNGNPLN